MFKNLKYEYAAHNLLYEYNFFFIIKIAIYIILKNVLKFSMVLYKNICMKL